MSANADACARATAAALEVVTEICEGVEGTIEEVADGVFVFVDEDAKGEFAFDTNSPETPEEREAAVESCTDSEWAEGIAAGFFGPDPPADAMADMKRRVCEGLFDEPADPGRSTSPDGSPAERAMLRAGGS